MMDILCPLFSDNLGLDSSLLGHRAGNSDGTYVIFVAHQYQTTLLLELHCSLVKQWVEVIKKCLTHCSDIVKFFATSLISTSRILFSSWCAIWVSKSVFGRICHNLFLRGIPIFVLRQILRSEHVSVLKPPSI